MHLKNECTLFMSHTKDWTEEFLLFLFLIKYYLTIFRRYIEKNCNMVPALKQITLGAERRLINNDQYRKANFSV
jgi:hypothetical protein